MNGKMNCTVTAYPKGKLRTLFPKSFEIRSSRDSPADSFTGIFPSGTSLSPGDAIEVLSLESERLFYGFVEDFSSVISREEPSVASLQVTTQPSPKVQSAPRLIIA